MRCIFYLGDDRHASLIKDLFNSEEGKDWRHSNKKLKHDNQSGKHTNACHCNVQNSPQNTFQDKY